ncbi:MULTISPECIES: hypothetical protein [Bacillus cereus group]|uniref:hypothetical protein n=1 Tax=Bacillus cereus group TaxID=86661 RepID=UPI000BEB9D08|nr:MULTISPECIES: hypothetical protein [Bacillus cereus group]PDY74465.1 hypothetical protein CON10_22425 [Bacillus cereus]PEC88380.1 hypothetical protein CON02_25140 [Bacillus cereus]PEE11850.1 hypothetical protein CON52_11620 [Bacillus cereus]PET85464.1 hypothetical protein CN530_07650 [Bacillus cereus]PEX67282.1 hypothetical protein CN460_23375 [Bacillus cereus]
MKKWWNHFIVRYDRFFNFIENHSVLLVMTLILICIIGNKILINLKTPISFETLDKYILNDIGDILTKKEGTLTTLAAVFIGIYFTVFSLLGSIKLESTFALLTQKNFKKLLKFIRNAFIGSFLYLFYSLFSKLISNDWTSYVINLTLLLYMLLSALRFGIAIYLIFKKDLHQLHQHLENEQRQRKHLNNLYKKLEQFLNEEQKSQNIQASQEFIQKMKEREKNKK